MAKPVICLACFKLLEQSENVFSCSKKHRYCSPCGKSMHLKCECYESLQLLTSEIFEEPIGTIECLGQTLAVWQCEWRGLKDDFYEHFIRSHNNIEVFQQLQVSSVPFLSDQLLSAMTLVRAFDSNFIFYYHSCPAKKMIYFLIFRLDIDVDDRAKPETLIYELMVKSPTEENHCKLKFVEKCYQLEDDIFRIRDEELCAAITFQSIQKHLYQGHIHFSFLIKKSCSDTSTSTDGKKKCCDPKKVGQVTKVDSKPFSFANKGLMRGNNARKGQSIPSASASSSPAPANATANSANTQSATTSSATAEPATKSQPPDYSSINRVGEDKTPAFGNPFHRSCSTDEMISLSNSFMLLNTQPPASTNGSVTAAWLRNYNLQQQQHQARNETYHIPKVMCQSYKAVDHKMYRQKYPSSCLSKPVLKK